MKQVCSCVVLVYLLALVSAHAVAQMTHSVRPRAGVERNVAAYYDYRHPELGSFGLKYEVGRRFDDSKPTVFVIADGQQYYVQAGLIAPLQDELFGDAFNVVGILGRGQNEAVLDRIKPKAIIDWQLAYQFLNSDQWIEDIEAVRQDLLGAGGGISLYGRSGGALLVDQYLSKHPQHVINVFTQAAVNRFVDAEYGLRSDTFWDELGAHDKTLQPMLLDVLEHHPSEHDRIILLLQRQNFFVPSGQIDAKRSFLIHLLHNWDEKEIAALSKQYQVDAVLASVTEGDPASSVRVFELFAPIALSQNDGKRIDPDFESGRIFGRPLFDLLAKQKIDPPLMDLTALTQITANVYLLAGRYDHTADYRSQIALASHFPYHRLLLLADGHDFIDLGKTGLYPQLVQAALADGIAGPKKRGIEQKLGALIYREY